MEEDSPGGPPDGPPGGGGSGGNDRHDEHGLLPPDMRSHRTMKSCVKDVVETAPVLLQGIACLASTDVAQFVVPIL